MIKTNADSDCPLVSIIIPSFNHGDYLENAIESVLQQTYPNIELIVIDDGSKDNSHEILSRYTDHPRITTILNKENRGQSHVFNRALEVASGEYVGMLPSDDWYLPNKVELQIRKFNESSANVGVVYCAGQRFYEDTGVTKDVILPVFTGQVAEKFITWGAFVYPVTPLFRTECFDVAPMDESYKAEGEAVYIRIALHYEFEYVPEVLAVMRDHSYNIGKDASVMYGEVYRYWDEFFKRDDLPESITSLRSECMERLHRVKGMQFIGDKRDFKLGRRCLLRAIREKPSLIAKPKVVIALLLTFAPEPLANAVLDRKPGG